MLALARPGSLIVIAGPYERQARIIFDRVLELVERVGAVEDVDLEARQTYRLYLKLTNGSEIIGGAAEFPDSFRGLGPDLVILDEAVWIPDFAWIEVFQPALADKRGRAIIISTPYRGSWFDRLFDRQRAALVREAQAKGKDSERYLAEQMEWSFHTYPTWENTAVFPLGPDDPEIRMLRRSQPPDTFLLEVAAVAMPAPDLVYPQFRADVHVKRCPIDQDLPVGLGIDPSASINAYAVCAFQDLKSRVHQVGEYAQKGVLAEEVIEACARLPWWPRVDFAVMDSAAVYDLRIWQQHPLVDFGVVAVKKPRIEERFAVVREWLLDPAAYDDVLMETRRRAMAEMHYAGEWADLPVEEKADIEVYARASIEPTDLRKCVRYFIDPSCINTINEFQTYRYQRRKDSSLNWPDRPRDADDHNVDSAGYWFWHEKRWDAVSRVADRERKPYAVTVMDGKVRKEPAGLHGNAAIDVLRRMTFAGRIQSSR